MLYEMLVGNMKGGQTYWKHKKTESESESFLCIFVMPPCISAILLSGFKICILLPSQTSFSNEKPFSQIPLSTWEDIVHLRTEQMPLKNIPKISKGFPGFSKMLQNIPKYSGTFQDIPEIVHLSRMVLPGLKYFSETGWPWSSTAVNSGTENIDLVFANV